MYGQYGGTLRMSINLVTCKGKSPDTSTCPMPSHSDPQIQHLFIMTGASKGTSLEMARQLLSPHHQILCISRTAATSLAQETELDRCGHRSSWSLSFRSFEPRHHELRSMNQMLFGQLFGQFCFAFSNGFQDLGVLIPNISRLLIFDQHLPHHALRVG